MGRYNATQTDAINRAARSMFDEGIPLASELEAIFSLIAAGSIGITAAAAEVDSLAKGGGAFGQDTDTTTGLTFGYKAGRLHIGSSQLAVAAGTILLSASTTNYVEVDRAGTVSTNTSGFTTGRLPLYTIATGGSSISTVTSSKALLTLIGARGVPGTLLSDQAATKTVILGGIADVSATGSFTIPLPAVAGRVTRVAVGVATTVSANDTDYWTFGVQNKGAAGTGTTVVVNAATATNRTTVAGGALTANVMRALTLTPTTADLVTAAGDALVLTATKVSSGANLVRFVVAVDVQFDA